MALLYSALVLGTTTTKASTSIVKHKLPVLVVYNVLKEVSAGVIFVKLIAIMAMHGRTDYAGSQPIQRTTQILDLYKAVDHLYKLVVVLDVRTEVEGIWVYLQLVEY